MQIRKMKPADIPEVVAIESSHYENPISETDLHKEIKNKNNGSEHPSLAPVVAVEDGEIAGYCLFDRCGRSSKSLTLLIVSTMKGKERQGIATKLVNHVKKKMKTLRYRSITARVHQDRIPAMNFLASSGFNCTGTDDTKIGEKQCEIYNFSYSIPMDDLSARHIAKIAKECREARASRQEED
jgi:predicted N-acetyltransferase YhbS